MIVFYLASLPLLEYLELSMTISNKVLQWKDLERFIMLGTDESQLHADEFFFLYLRFFYLISKQNFV